MTTSTTTTRAITKPPKLLVVGTRIISSRLVVSPPQDTRGVLSLLVLPSINGEQDPVCGRRPFICPRRSIRRVSRRNWTRPMRFNPGRPKHRTCIPWSFPCILPFECSSHHLWAQMTTATKTTMTTTRGATGLSLDPLCKPNPVVWDSEPFPSTTTTAVNCASITNPLPFAESIGTTRILRTSFVP